MRLLWASLAMVLAQMAVAHELWIEPRDYQIAPGDVLAADIRVGENLDGAAYAYLPRDFRQFDLISASGILPVEGRPGDRPALKAVAEEDGLITIAYVTRDLFLTYTSMEKFAKFARHKDFEWAVDEHRTRGLSEDKFKERYVRYAKSLVAVGSGAGQDVEFGLVTEIVALANPYTDDMTDGLPVKVLWNGAPRADAQVELFAKAPDDTVTVTFHRTDADGVARLPVTPGHSYLADAVALQALDPGEEHGSAWESLWASLTFYVP